MKLVRGKVYNGWRYTVLDHNGKCDKCGKPRHNFHEFIREDTPYGDNWNGFKYPEEPLRLGSECVNSFINGDWKYVYAPVEKRKEIM